MKAGKQPIIRESFAMPFGGGKIFFSELDGLGENKTLVMDKFERDMKTLKKPSATSLAGLHVKDTAIDREMAQSMLHGLNGEGQHLKKVAVVGLAFWNRLLWRRLKRAMDPPARFVCGFFEDFEKAKIWLVK